MIAAQKSIPITERSSIGEARRSAIHAAQLLGFDEGRRSDIGIVATEAATNILVHAQSGELLICPFVQGGSFWLDLIALDSGPGIADVSRALEDGFSSAGTAGQGLGAIGRLTNAYSLYTARDKGTVCWCRFSHGGPQSDMSVGLVNIPVARETECGDAVLIRRSSARDLYMVVDGLGHGAGAAKAAEAAVEAVDRFASESLPEILIRTHDALKVTRGAAMSLAAVDRDRRLVMHAGIGNVAAILYTGNLSRSLMAQNGTLGAVLPRVPQEYSYPLEPNSSLLMFSDGLSTKKTVSNYVGLLNRPPGLVAALLYRDFARKRDDATALYAPIGAIG